MLSELFLFQLVLSFIFGGLVVALSLYLAERFGVKFGTALLSTPTTSLVSFLFMGITNSVEFVLQTIPPALLSLSATLIFVGIFIQFSEKLKKNTLWFSLLVWAFLAFFIIQYRDNDLQIPILIFFLVYLIINVLFKKKNAKIELDKVKQSMKLFIYRAILAGFVISMAVLLGKLFGPVWGGVFTMFPAAFSSSFFILQKDHGIEKAVAFARSLIPPYVVFVFYALAVYFSYPIFGLYLGTIISLLPTWVLAYIIYLINSRV
ncbi:MAG: hypothetical protein Q7S22_04425 [Candidatus Micrarchaeota archaeon]|nr:hypothetical protein [Candidatus Micrarchaeota archaeon]